MLVAPSAIAFDTRRVVGDAAVDRFTGDGRTPRYRCAGEDGVQQRPARQPHLLAGRRVGRHDMHHDRHLLERGAREVRRDQRPQP